MYGAARPGTFSWTGVRQCIIFFRMSWLEVSFDTDAHCAEPYCDVLLASGALSATIEDADANTPDEVQKYGEPGMSSDTDLTAGWSRARVSVLFEPDVDAVAQVSMAGAALGVLTSDCRLHTVPDENWIAKTQAQFSPIQVSEKLWICPSWCEPPEPDVINIRINPGMAFGAGSHPTTRLCLQWLAQEAAPELAMLDYGCGSGVLAITAARLGCDPVVGVDIDKAALETARQNADYNAIQVDFADATTALEARFDLIVANILTNPLKALAPILTKHLSTNGRLALSGVLATQADEVIASYLPWLPLQVVDELDGWACLSNPTRGSN